MRDELGLKVDDRHRDLLVPVQIGRIADLNLYQLVGVNILPLLALLFLISSFSPEFRALSDGG